MSIILNSNFNIKRFIIIIILNKKKEFKQFKLFEIIQFFKHFIYQKFFSSKNHLKKLKKILDLFFINVFNFNWD